MKNKILNFFDKTFLKFIIVGVINTLFGSVIMFVFYNVFHLGYWISSISNYVLASISSYFLNKYFTFNKKEKSVKYVLLFAANIVVCYFIAYGIAKPLVGLILSSSLPSVKDNISMLTGMCLFVILNYISQRFFVFKSNKES